MPATKVKKIQLSLKMIHEYIPSPVVSYWENVLLKKLETQALSAQIQYGNRRRAVS